VAGAAPPAPGIVRDLSGCRAKDTDSRSKADMIRDQATRPLEDPQLPSATSSEPCGADGATSKVVDRQQIGGPRAALLVVPRSAATAFTRTQWLSRIG
jgi:hypothetical protein